MEQDQTKQSTLIDEYIMRFPPEVQDKLNTLREVIREAAPNAVGKNKLSNAYFLFIWKLGSLCSL